MLVGLGCSPGAPKTAVDAGALEVTYGVAGTVSGLSGTLVLKLGAEELTLTADGPFAFATRLVDGQAYAVSVSADPARQHCTVTNGSGVVDGADVEAVAVDCAPHRYAVGGTVQGLIGTVVLSLNGGQDLEWSSDGPFTFAQPLADGSAYAVAVRTQPSRQTCTVEQGQGTLDGAPVSDVVVRCVTHTFTVGGQVSGLAGTVVLELGNEALTVSQSGGFTFTTRLEQDQAYAVTVTTPPVGQSCTVSGDTGTMPAGDVTDVAVTCTTFTYPLGGTVAGLSGTLVLSNSGGPDLELSADGPFSFPAEVSHGQSYQVNVVSAPVAQRCQLERGSGTMTGEVLDVAVTCVDVFTVGGTLSGLVGGSLVVRNNGGDPLTLTADGPFTFGGRLAQGESYLVTAGPPPGGVRCEVTAGAGVMGTGPKEDVVVTCRTLRLVIDEVHARPASDLYGDANHDGVRSGTQDEFVELLNADSLPLDVAGWMLRRGTSTMTTVYTFPTGTVLDPGQRVVIFGGGTPTLSFGGALLATASNLQLTDAPTSELAIEVVAAGSGLVLDSFSYDATTFGSTCTTTCASQTRWPSGTGPFVAHSVAAGVAGILWSPGVSPPEAIPKVAPMHSTPRPAQDPVSVASPVTVRFNMYMDPTDLADGGVRLFASGCGGLADEVTDFSWRGTGQNAAHALLQPAQPLAYETTHCVLVEEPARSAAGAALELESRYDFTTRPAQSAPAQTVVLSEFGVAAGNNEFVELYNPTDAAVDISGWHLQRRTAAGGTATCLATLPPNTSLPPGGYFLVGASGYQASTWGVAEDFRSTTAPLTGGSESLVLFIGPSCTSLSTATAIVDSVSAGTITDTHPALALPAYPTALGTTGESLERKACFDSSGDGDPATGMFEAGGHQDQGNSERFGASDTDWVLRASPQPQNSASPAEVRSCP
jgi:hypothetical protein